MDVHARASYLPIAPQKLRLVADVVRGLEAEQAATRLKFMPHKGAQIVAKLLHSAMANAEQNFELNRQDLFISEIRVDEAPRQRRVKAGARGRYKPRIKRASHLILTLRQYDYQEVAK